MSSTSLANNIVHDKSCVAATTKIVGDKWTPMLLFALAEGPKRFCQLQEEAGGVNPRTLSARLEALDGTGIVKRSVFPEVPPRVEYELTEKGRDLLPVIRSMIAWANKYTCSPNQ